MACRRVWSVLRLVASGVVLMQLVGGCDSILASLAGDFAARYLMEFLRSGGLT